jgi:para-nitrobenzyl esterase
MQAAAPDGTPVLAPTTSGTVQGAWHHGIARFAGIPYAAPPVGDLRFRPPAPAAPWEGERDATTFGPVSPQNPSLMDALFGGEAEQWDEDCLYLNVWTGAPTASETARPVMVWIHGGGFEMGSGSSPLYHGDSFAHEGVVLVTLNYRLGSVGFLELGSLDESEAGSGNVGLLDQVAALEWVRDNIAAFGGDPDNVTIFGESAGAMSVGLLLSMPRARGLFHKAIAQSGAASAAKTPDQAAADTQEFLAATGLSTVEELRAAPIATLLAGHATMAAARVSDPEGVPLLIGTNLEEWKLFALATPPVPTEEALVQRVGLVTDDPAGALDAYRVEYPDADLAAVECAVLTDVVFRIPAVQLADAQSSHAPVYQYRFDWRSPALGGMIGAAHAVEIPFVFDMIEDHRLHVLVGPEAPRSLSRAMHESWVAFARDGAPAAAAYPSWPTVDGEGRPVMRFEAESTLLMDPEGTTTKFWASTRD